MPSKIKKPGKIRAFICAIIVFIILFFTAVVIGAMSFPEAMPAWFALVILGVPIAGAVVAYTYVKRSIESRQTAILDADITSMPPAEPALSVKPDAPRIDAPPIAPAEPKLQPGVDPDPLDIIEEMESHFENMYRFAYEHMLNAEDCRRAYNAVVQKYAAMDLPLAAEVRFEQLCEEWAEKFKAPNPMVEVDAMSGTEFEHWCADLLSGVGFANVTVTPESGDQGVDIIAEKGGVRYAVQCKRYASDLSNTPVQEVYAGKEMYHCQVAAVMTNQHFTPGAKSLADKTGVLLWNREALLTMLQKRRQGYEEF